jgi:hypothetical protein
LHVKPHVAPEQVGVVPESGFPLSGQTLPQLPQLAGSVWLSESQPVFELSQSWKVPVQVNPQVLTEHARVAFVKPPGQDLPQVPQLLTSCEVSSSQPLALRPSQLLKVVVQFRLQTPAAHTGASFPAPHTAPH